MSNKRQGRNSKKFKKAVASKRARAALRTGGRARYRVAPQKSAEEKAKENIMTTQPVGRAPKKPTRAPITTQGPKNIPEQAVKPQPIKGGRPSVPVMPPAGQTTGINPNPMEGLPTTDRPVKQAPIRSTPLPVKQMVDESEIPALAENLEGIIRPVGVRGEQATQPLVDTGPDESLSPLAGMTQEQLQTAMPADAAAARRQQAANSQNQNFQQETPDNAAGARRVVRAIREAAQGAGPGNNTRAPNIDTDGDGVPDVYVPGIPGTSTGTGTGSWRTFRRSNRS